MGGSLGCLAAPVKDHECPTLLLGNQHHSVTEDLQLLPTMRLRTNTPVRLPRPVVRPRAPASPSRTHSSGSSTSHSSTSSCLPPPRKRRAGRRARIGSRERAGAELSRSRRTGPLVDTPHLPVGSSGSARSPSSAAGFAASSTILRTFSWSRAGAAWRTKTSSTCLSWSAKLSA